MLHAPKRRAGRAVAVVAGLAVAVVPLAASPALAKAPTLTVDKYIDTTNGPTTIVGGSSQDVRYVIDVTANGGKANDVVLTDVLPEGLTFTAATAGVCAEDDGTVTCDLGDIARNTTASVAIRATVDEFYADPTDVADSRLQYAKSQVFVEMVDEVTTAEVSCPSGFVPVDGGLVVNDGPVSGDIFVTNSSALLDGWHVQVLNETGQRVTGDLVVACLGEETSGGTVFPLDISATGQNGPTSVLDSEEDTLTLTTGGCPAGTVPVSPSYDVDGAGLLLSSGPDADNGWTFVLEAVDADLAGSAARQCLSEETADGLGRLSFTSPEQPVEGTVPDGATTDVRPTCVGDAKDLTGSFITETGVLHLGMLPGDGSRGQRFYNDAGEDETVVADVQCVETAVTPTEGSKKITNTATAVSSNAGSASGSADLRAIATGEVPKQSVEIDNVRIQNNGKRVKADVTCALRCTVTGYATADKRYGTIKKGKRFAYGKLRLAAGESGVLKMKVKKRYRDAASTVSASMEYTATFRGSGFDTVEIEK